MRAPVFLAFLFSCCGFLVELIVLELELVENAVCVVSGGVLGDLTTCNVSILIEDDRDNGHTVKQSLFCCVQVLGSCIVILFSEDGFDKLIVRFGIKACDVRGVAVLDKVFLSDPVDSYYAARREHGVIVSLACARPETSCFCGAFGIDATAPQGDVTTWLDGENLYWQANTEKGEALTASVQALLVEGGEAEVEAQKAATTAVLEKLPFATLDLSKFKPENLNELFNAKNGKK